MPTVLMYSTTKCPNAKSLRLLLTLFLVMALSTVLSAQSGQLSNQRQQIIPFKTGTFTLDSMTILSSSLKAYLVLSDSTITENELNDSYYFIDNQKIILQALDSLSANYPFLFLSYRVLPYNLGQPRSHFDTTLISSIVDSHILKFSYNPFVKKKEDLIDFGTLQHGGSLSRGLAFGNNQNLILDSRFNLQLAGNLGNGIEILAAITDENIPIQPEGNTRQLQEFDRIFIQLKQKNNQIVAGDYELARPQSYFMNYFKKLQGATLSNKLVTKKGANWQNQASLAISRGKFARNLIDGIEGNQGPYKLRGNEGERFIIVLSGTEKIFIDGVPLIRGFDEDYVIDYDQSELRFTNKRLITKDSRIIAEFEYADQNYLTSLYTFNTHYAYEKWNVRFNFFSQQDGRNAIGEGVLTDEQKSILTQAGDQINLAIVSSLDTLEEFNALRVQYEQRDTFVLINERLTKFSILIYTIDPSARLTARFSNVGVNNGNYRLSTNQVAASGRVYEWVAPDPRTGQPRGEYEPVIQLAIPKQQQLMTTSVDYQLSKNGQLQAEVAFSNNDLNRFSTLDNEDNMGVATFATYEQTFSSDKLGKLQLLANHEWTQRHFTSLNPYRNPEFIRDWSIEQQNLALSEHISKVGFKWQSTQLGNIAYEIGHFLRDSVYQGIKHFSRWQFNQHNWLIDAQGSFLQAQSSKETNDFFRPRINIEKTFERLNSWKAKFYTEREKNSRQLMNTDTLSTNSFYYDLYRVALASPEKQSLQHQIQFSQRYDYQPIQEKYIPFSLANEWNFSGTWDKQRLSQLQWNLTYRNLDVSTTNTTLQPQSTYLGRINHSLQFNKGVARATTIYEISSGQEPRIEYNYLQVQKGAGVYEWIDYNGDGVPQINEFEVANFQDNADYVRIAIFTDQFIKSNQVQYNQNIQINPKIIWEKKEDWRKYLAKFATQSNIRIQRRTGVLDGVSIWNPFQLNIPDTALVAINAFTRNTLFFQRGHIKWESQIGHQNNQQQKILTAGFEQTKATETFFRSRWNIATQWGTQVQLTQSQRISQTEFFNNRNYVIRQFNVVPQLTWLPSATFRAVMELQFRQSQNESGDESLSTQNITLETTYNQSATTALQMRFSYAKVNFDGNVRTPAAFAMLNGLRSGQNYLWNITLDRQLGRNLRLNFSYEGRKTGDLKMVHIGRAQVNAIF